MVYKDDDKLQIVDGQQRMTTFFLMLCSIAKHYRANGIDSSTFDQLINTPGVDNDTGLPYNYYTLELQYEDSSECLANIWEEKVPVNRKGIPQSCENIYHAYEIINKRLSLDFTDFSDYGKFAAFLINKVVFIQIGAPNMSDALKIFETINQRGVSLNSMDLLKNLLFMNIKQSEYKKLNDKWKKMVDQLDKIKESCCWHASGGFRSCGNERIHIHHPNHRDQPTLP